MIVVDTTVLVYAVGTAHPYRDPCRAVVGAIQAGQLRATTTVEVVQEFAHVRSRRRGRDDARALAIDYTDLFSPLLATTEAHLRAGLELWSAHPGVGVFDAVLAAAARDFGADYLVSSDRAFSALTEITHLLPDAEGVSGLLGNQ